MTSYQENHDLLKICTLAPVIPVLVVDETSKAVPLAKALITGGLKVLEVTLRTDNALAVIKEMVNSNAEGIIGAGTLLSEKDVYAAKKAGAKFGVSPGATEQILRACAEVSLPLLPGAATPSEVMSLLSKGYSVQKFFPAESNGGVKALKSILSHNENSLPVVGDPNTGISCVVIADVFAVFASSIIPEYDPKWKNALPDPDSLKCLNLTAI